MEAQAFRTLTSEEKLAHYPSGVMASGESNFFDNRQRVGPSGFAINSVYPSPDDFTTTVVPYGSSSSTSSSAGGVTKKAFTLPMNFGTPATGVYNRYVDKEPWNVETSGYDPIKNPNWPPAVVLPSGTGDGSETETTP